MPAPERRTRVDLAVCGLIAVIVAVAAFAVWWASPERATVSVPAAAEAPAPRPAESAPAGLAEAWRAPDGAAAMPLAVGGTVVTADGDAVTGRDYRTGDVRWTYRRDVPLCAATAAFDDAIAVYRTGNGCSEVTAVDAATGRSGPQRSGAFDDTMRLHVDDEYVTASGPTRLESWRSDLVRTLEYGRVDAPVQPDSQPRTGCTFSSVAAASSRIAVIEHCPRDDGPRLTILDPAPEDASKPDVYGSQVLGIDGAPLQRARVVAASDRTVAVVASAPEAPAGSASGAGGRDGGEDGNSDGSGRSGGDGHSGTSAAHLLLYGPTADRRSSTDLPVALSDDAVVGVPSGPIVTLWTGSGPDGTGWTVALDAHTLALRWTMPGTIGPGTLMGRDLLVPVPDGLAVVEPSGGERTRTLPVDRTGGRSDANGDGAPAGPVIPAAVGGTVLEQRGGEVVALAPDDPAPDAAAGTGVPAPGEDHTDPDQE